MRGKLTAKARKEKENKFSSHYMYGWEHVTCHVKSMDQIGEQLCSYLQAITDENCVWPLNQAMPLPGVAACDFRSICVHQGKDLLSRVPVLVELTSYACCLLFVSGKGPDSFERIMASHPWLWWWDSVYRWGLYDALHTQTRSKCWAFYVEHLNVIWGRLSGFVWLFASDQKSSHLMTLNFHIHIDFKYKHVVAYGLITGIVSCRRVSGCFLWHYAEIKWQCKK